MVAVDTNIIVGLLTQDDESQYQKSLEVFQTQNVFITDTVILETEWVLRFAYKFKPAEICEALKRLFGLPNVHLNNASLVAQSLQWYEAGLDFADAFHLANSQNHTKLYTFDEKFVRFHNGSVRKGGTYLSICQKGACIQSDPLFFSLGSII